MAFDSWDVVPVGLQNELYDARNQWEALDGFSHSVDTATLLAMANAGFSGSGSAATTLYGDLSGFSHYMWAHGLGDGAKPWTGLGLTRDQYVSSLTNLADRWSQLTGQNPDLGAITSWYGSGDMSDPSTAYLGNLFWQALTNGTTAVEFGNQIKNSQVVQKNYGWVKYGLDYNTFQEQKLSMKQAFGRELTDPEAVTQLGYFHTSSGSSAGARTQTQQQQGPAVTTSVIR